MTKDEDWDILLIKRENYLQKWYDFFDKFKMKLDFTMAFKHFPFGDKVLRQVNYWLSTIDYH